MAGLNLVGMTLLIGATTERGCQPMNTPDALRVSLQPPTDRGRLYYRLDPQVDSHLLFVSNPIKRRSEYEVNIDGGRAMLDIDHERVLYKVECVIMRRAWKRMTNLPKPVAFVSADLHFDHLVERHTELDLNVTIATDPTYAQALVTIEKEQANGSWVALSEHVYALVDDNLLRGFYVNLK
jgi:hypothetical protein